MCHTKSNVLLFVTTEEVDDTCHYIEAAFPARTVFYLRLGNTTVQSSVPERWTQVDAAEFLDVDALRRDFLNFLEEWPKIPILKGKSFDDLFRRYGGYSVWWTGPAIHRHPEGRMFLQMKNVWLVDRVLKALKPKRVLIFTQQAELAWVLGSRCRADRLDHEFLPGSANPDSFCRKKPLSSGSIERWLIRSLIHLCRLPFRLGLRAIIARHSTRIRRDTRYEREKPAIVFASTASCHVRVHEGNGGIKVEMSFWKELAHALEVQAPYIRQRHLLNLPKVFRQWRSVFSYYHEFWPLVRHLDGAVPIENAFFPVLKFLQVLPLHLTSLFRYYRVERSSSFNLSFIFAGSDVSLFFIPDLRESVTSFSDWACSVAAIVESFKAVGRVIAVIVEDEMYPRGSAIIAAARELRITTVGVQHGAIFPMHLMYTLPPGQVIGAPIPDYFAAYGQYAKETLCRHGSFPRHRVWITGSQSFDRLKRHGNESKQVIRTRLKLPADKKIVLVTTQLIPWDADAVRAAVEAAKGRDDLLVCIKTHPRDPQPERFKQLIDSASASHVVMFTEGFDDLLQACDVLIGATSTTLLEAILIGRPTICVNFSDEPERYAYVADGGALGARSVNELRTAIDAALATGRDLQDRRLAFLRRHLGPSPLKPSAAVLARKIIDVISLGQPNVESRECIGH